MKNETTRLVSFFLLSLCLDPIPTTRAYPIDDEHWSDASNSFRERLERASPEQWLELIDRSAKAMFGASWLEDRGALPPEDLPKSQRTTWFSEQIGRWVNSKAFYQEQTQSWIDHRLKDSPSLNRAWDIRLHDAWIKNSVEHNESFLHFLQCQVAGDVLCQGSEHRLATAAWYRGTDSFLPEGRFKSISTSEMPLSRRFSPTPDQLTRNLRWTSLSNLPWLYWQASELQQTRLRDLENSMVSVLSAEQQDWQRLKNDIFVTRWHRSQTTWPRPNPSDRTFHLEEREKPKRYSSQSDSRASYDLAYPWRSTQPWTVILEIEIPESNRSSKLESHVLVQQRVADDPGIMPQHQTIAIIWNQERISVQMIHALPHSYLAIETEPISPSLGIHTVAITYEGIPSADSIGIWVDGQWQKTRTLHNVLVRDVFASNHTMELDVEIAPIGPKPRVLQLESYRSTLSTLELEGWRQSEEWKAWEACSEDEKLASREHYARRVDPPWRYQRESFSFYAASFSSLLSEIGMIPIPESEETLELPSGLAAAFGADPDSRGWSLERRQTTAMDFENRLALQVSSQEATRQWNRMLVRAGNRKLAENPMDEHLLDRCIKPWAQSWDRRTLIRSLLLSDQWLMIALDSSR